MEMKTIKHSSGQALAEYMPVLTGSVFGVVTIAWIFGTGVGNIYTDILDRMTALGSPATESESAGEGDICVYFEADQGGSQCEQDENCTQLPGSNSGFYADQQGEIEVLVIKAGKEYHVYNSGVTEDGCYNVSIAGNSATWEKVGGGSSCKDVSHLQSWRVPFCN